MFQDALEATGSLISGLSTRLKRTLGITTEAVILPDGQDAAPRGVGGAGFATVVNRPRFESHDLFTPGRCFRLRMRHANFSSDGRLIITFPYLLFFLTHVRFWATGITIFHLFSIFIKTIFLNL